MNKQEIIKIIHNTRMSHTAWADQGQKSVDAINLDRMIHPVKYNETELYIWIESNKKNICVFSWYKELVQLHEKSHRKYCNLFYEATRKYNPKTRDELVEEFKSLGLELDQFNNKINEIENELSDMSDEVYLDIVLKSNAESRKLEKNDQSTNSDSVNNEKTALNPISEVTIKSNSSSSMYSNADSKTIINEDSVKAEELNDQNMQKIDISKYQDKEIDQKQAINNEVNEKKLVDDDDSINLNSNFISDLKAINKIINSSENLSKHITLKEQHLNQLKQEQELIEQELTHLDETQKLSKQGLEQLERNLSLKQQEIELEQLDNEKLLEFNELSIDKIKNNLDIIVGKKLNINNEIVDLEQKNIEDQLKQESGLQTQPLEKKFEVLKNNKKADLSTLQEHLSVRKIDLMKLKEQLLLLEDEISEMEENINLKQKDISDLEKQERLKNDKHTQLSAKHEDNVNNRLASIKAKQKEFDVFTADAESTQKELDSHNIHLEQMNKAITFTLNAGNDEIANLDQQRVKKQTKLTEIYVQKIDKEKEIEQIKIHIEKTENNLEELKLERSNSDKEVEIVD